MNRINLETDIRPVSDFRANITSIIEEIKRTKRPVVLTQHGRSAAVVLDVAEYEKILEKMEQYQTDEGTIQVPNVLRDYMKCDIIK